MEDIAHKPFAVGVTPISLGSNVQRATDVLEVLGDQLALLVRHAVAKAVLPHRLGNVEKAPVQGVDEDVDHIELGERGAELLLVGRVVLEVSNAPCCPLFLPLGRLVLAQHEYDCSLDVVVLLALEEDVASVSRAPPRSRPIRPEHRQG